MGGAMSTEKSGLIPLGLLQELTPRALGRMDPVTY